MSNAFEQAAKIARERQAWEAEVNPKREAWIFAGLTESQMAQSQRQIEAFQEAMIAAAKKGGLGSAEKVKAELDALDYETQYVPLWRFAESCLPIQEETMEIARQLAPARLGAVERIREGKFGVYERQEEEGGVIVHLAESRTDSPNSTRSLPREQQEARMLEQGKAFNDLAGAMGAAMRGGAKPRKSLDQARKSLDRLGGVKVVEGERLSVGPTDKHGQIGLFGEDLAPTPPKQEKPRAKAGKAPK